jgi:hypothetical protein
LTALKNAPSFEDVATIALPSMRARPCFQRRGTSNALPLVELFAAAAFALTKSPPMPCGLTYSTDCLKFSSPVHPSSFGQLVKNACGHDAMFIGGALG